MSGGASRGGPAAPGSGPISSGAVPHGKPSLNKFALFRLMTVERAMRQTTSVVETTKLEIETKMRTSCSEMQEIEKQIEAKRLNNDMLKEYKSSLRKAISHCEDSKNKSKAECVENRDRLNSLRDELEKKRKNLEASRQAYSEKREMYLKINALLLVRRKQLINEIANIYPVEERVDKSGRRDYSIFGFVVPNADDISSIKSADEDKVATGLGYTAHILLMISQFLDMPLRFHIVHCGSRSRIQDHITKELLERDREFPLHSKGKEKFLFNYGVFLLNKNIAQLRHYCGMTTQDLRNTLPNLHSLLEQRLGVQFGDKAPVRSGAGFHSLPSTSKPIIHADSLVGVFKGQTKSSTPDPKEDPVIKPVDDARLNPAMPNSPDSPNQNGSLETGPGSSNVETQSASGDEEKDERDEKEEWLRRNPKMAAIIDGDSNPRQVDSEEESAANSEDGEKCSISSETDAACVKGKEALDSVHLSAVGGVDQDEVNEATTPIAEVPSSDSIDNDVNDGDQQQTFISKGSNSELVNKRDSSVPDNGSYAAASANAASSDGKNSSSDIPKGLRSSNQPKLKAGSRPAGLSLAAASASRGVPKGLSRSNNARSSSSSFHAGGSSGGRTQQSASKLIAETFAKHNKPDAPAGGHAKDSDPSQRNSILTNTNFNLVDRSKRVISDD